MCVGPIVGQGPPQAQTSRPPFIPPPPNPLPTLAPRIDLPKTGVNSLKVQR